MVHSFCSRSSLMAISAALLMVGVVLMPLHASAKDDRPCDEMVKECFLLAPTDRGQCFRRSAQGEACLGTPLGDLAADRFRAVPEEGLNSEAIDGGTLSFLGPQVADQACLNRFDTLLSSSLILGEITQGDYQRLANELSRCAPPPLELPKP